MSNQHIRYLLDSDVFIDYSLGREPSTQLLNRLMGEGIGFSMLSYGEVLEGTLRHPSHSGRHQKATFAAILAMVTILDLSVEIMAVFAELRFELRQKGRLIGDIDTLVAATALTHDLTLITRNIRHFERVPSLRLLTPFPPE